MQRISLWLSIILLGLSACIKPFDPVINDSDAKKYVVSGKVTDSVGWQIVEISTTSAVGAPEYIPLSNCTVTIDDNEGHSFPLEEFTPGYYRVWMDATVLKVGTAYRVTVLTPKGESLVSGYDTMQRCAPVDSVYHKIEDIPTTDPMVNNRVMQFYVDLDARGAYSDYYKWDVTETWEFYAAQPKEYYYDGTHHTIHPPDYSTYYCWSTVDVKNVFTISVQNLAQKQYFGYPLHTIDGHTSRLSVLYSFLVTQYALSAAAFDYWEQLRKNSNDQGGLYEKQPLAVQGNMRNLTNPNQNVLGYFYAAATHSKRYFYREVEGIELDFDNHCFEEPLFVGGFRNYAPEEYPVYYYYFMGAVRVMSNECVDCRLQAGKVTKPSFWPE